MTRLFKFIAVLIGFLMLLSGVGQAQQQPPQQMPMQPQPMIQSPQQMVNPNQQQQQPIQPLPQQTTQEVMQDIHDIKPLEIFGINPKWFMYLIWAVLGLLGILLLWITFRVLMNRKRGGKKFQTVVLKPEAIAFGALDALENAEFSDIRQYYFELSMILRTYIELRFLMNAKEMTTEELIPLIKELPIDKETSAGLKNFLLTSDPVKFAGSTVESQTMKNDLQWVRDFVQKTIPQPDNADNHTDKTDKTHV
ncbi:MAG: hypothetical protein HQK77_02240 [Desulfobacterales bacterium]|nr:hypothetical protein [Desulfobacterales bacterium]